MDELQEIERRLWRNDAAVYAATYDYARSGIE
ncbi:hypothetical protein T190_31015 [Sinorhizobium meliloti CCBAU 01290]|nr:hypothetical protein T190_31015 [Sinorhizobium meliloti CCBAU 01290]